MRQRPSRRRVVCAFSAIGLAVVVASTVSLLGIQRQVIREQRARERATRIGYAKQRCDVFKQVILAHVERLVDRHPGLRSLRAIDEELVAEMEAFGFLHGQGLHALVVDERLEPVAFIEPRDAKRLCRCAVHVREGRQRFYLLPADAEATGAMPQRLCYTCPVQRGGTLLGGLVIHKELDPVGDAFADVNRAMTWTVVVTQFALLLVLTGVALSARRAIAAAERSRAEDERLAALGNLAAGIAHEVRNPLNTIGLTCRYLERFVGQTCEEPEARAELNRNFEIVANEVGRLTRTLDDFLLLAMPEDVHSRVPCDLDAVVDGSLAIFSKELEDAGIQLERRRVGELPIEADPDRLQQVFVNIIRNSIQAMRDGGTLAVTSDAANGRARVVFADSGPGIREADLHRIFEPYFTTRRSGLGLGLTLSRRIVADHGGSIDVANQPGGGAVFTVTLPARRQDGEGGADG